MWRGYEVTNEQVKNKVRKSTNNSNFEYEGEIELLRGKIQAKGEKRHETEERRAARHYSLK